MFIGQESEAQRGQMIAHGHCLSPRPVGAADREPRGWNTALGDDLSALDEPRMENGNSTQDSVQTERNMGTAGGGAFSW